MTIVMIYAPLIKFLVTPLLTSSEIIWGRSSEGCQHFYHPSCVYRWLRQRVLVYKGENKSYTHAGPVAQWITRLTTDQEIPGSTPGRLELLANFFFAYF